MEYRFYLNNLRMAPRKVRLITGLVKRMPVLEAEAQLKFNAKRAALPILKFLKSGVASAVNNFNLTPESLYVLNIFVDEGPMLKRFRARAFGRAGAIQKKTSHVTLVLEDRPVPGAKKAKKKKVSVPESEVKKDEIAKEKKERAEIIAPKEIKPTQKSSGFAKKIFRRKAIG